ncbi:DUF7529 family protein [Halomarina rubra]|uniref:Uncharacterized protein n=1 Tax=Halomarina rubra TaxID=2071873 RepID=A0ABD6ATR6_9EURY|nr:hypothetical protein [Halomarina rubra]
MDQTPDADREHPIERVADHWEAVVDDMNATADQLRDAGADVVELHPGDVVPRPDLGGFDVLVPNSEFDALREVVADTALPATDVFRAQADDVAFFVAVLAADDGSAAVCCPLYYHLTDDEVAQLQRDVYQEGSLRAFVRPLANDEAVVLQFDDPDVFFGGEADDTDDAPAVDGDGTA